MTREKDHSAALDGLRARLLESVRLQCALLNVDRQFDRGSLANERRALIRMIAAQIRALDAVRAYAADRAFFAELWMLMACGKSQDEAVREARKVLAERREIPGL